MTSNHIKFRKLILLPMALALALLLGCIIGAIYYQQQLMIDKEERERLDGVEKTLPLLIADEARILETALDSLAKEPLLQQAWLARDRAALLQAATPHFEGIRSRLKITHFYFIEPDATCFLRVHHPSLHGDTIQRLTMARARESGQPAGGLELGPLGTITFRVVQPWRLGGKIAGYLELGLELSQILPKLQESLGLEILVAIHKERLEQTRWEEGRRMLNLPAEWDRFEHVVLGGEKEQRIPKGLESFINLSLQEHRRQLFTSPIDGQTRYAGKIPLTDAGGIEVGDLLVLFDLAAESALQAKTLWLLLLIALVTSAGYGLIFFLFVGRVERQLDQAHQALRAESDAQQRTAGELGLYKEHLEELVLAQTEALHGTNRKLQEEVLLREAAENKARQALAEMEQIFSTSASGMQVVDTDHRVTRINPAFAELFGLGQAEAVTGTCFENISCPLADTPECCFQQILAGREHVAVEMEITHRNGHRIWVMHTAAKFHDADGKLLGMVQNFNDITTRKRAELEAREANAQWERTFDAMGDIVTIHDTEMRIVRANRAACEALGQTEEELIGRYCHEVFRGGASPCAGCPEAMARHDCQLHSAEIKHPKLGKIFLVSVSPLMNSQGEFSGIIQVARDITEQKKLEAQYRQAQKMEAVGTLSSGVAHDFNNLLTGILGFAELARMETRPGTQLHKDLGQIIQQGKRGADLVRQLMAFSHRQSLEKSVFNLNDLVANISKMLGRLIGEDVEYTFHPGQDLAGVEADAGQMEQVILNLAINARDAMPQGGKLMVTTSNVVLAENYPDRCLGLPFGDYVALTFRDTGCGMDQETREQIFEPFFSTKETGKGTGLGLATVYGIVKQHHGDILVSSEPGLGATFTVYLPASTAEKQPEASPQKAPPAPPVAEMILLVEDNAMVRQMVGRMLERQGYTVLGAADPDEAEALFGAHPEIDLLLTDLVMPKRNGKELYANLSRIRPALKVLFMSGHTDTTLQQKDIQVARQSFIKKPFTTEQLSHKVKETLALTEPGK